MKKMDKLCNERRSKIVERKTKWMIGFNNVKTPNCAHVTRFELLFRTKLSGVQSTPTITDNEKFKVASAESARPRNKRLKHCHSVISCFVYGVSGA